MFQRTGGYIVKRTIWHSFFHKSFQRTVENVDIFKLQETYNEVKKG